MAATPAPGWKCPTCGRRFARARQAHSCQVVSLAAHLQKAGPEVQRIYEGVIAELRACGPLDVVPTKTSINLLSRTSVGSIMLRKDTARLSIVLTHRVDDPRIQKVLPLSARSVVHYIDLASLGDLDGAVRGWLREAYQVGLLAGRRP